MDPHDQQQLRDAIRHELRDLQSLQKNGESWIQYLGKLLTPERVMLRE